MTDTTMETRMEAPPAFRERGVVRCTKAELKRTKKNSDPMIRTEWEFCGYFDKGVLKPDFVRGGILYKLAGLSANGGFGGVYFVLTPTMEDSFKKFYKLATGEVLPNDYDRENPPIEFLDGLLMEATVFSEQILQRKGITEEEKAEKVARGEQPIGDPIQDSDGNDLKQSVITINNRDGWGKRWTKDIPEPY